MLTKTDLSQIRKIFKDEVAPLKRDVKTLRSDVTSIRKDVKIIVNFFDTEYLELRKRVERIEDYLKLPTQTATP